MQLFSIFNSNLLLFPSQHLEVSTRTPIYLEPAIVYPNYEKDYKNLIGKIFKKIYPNKIDKVAIGMVKYSGQLLHLVKKLYPDSEMLDDSYELVEPEYSGDRYRYDFDERIKFYKMMIAEIRKYSNCNITLGVENHDVWEAIQLDGKKNSIKCFFSLRTLRLFSRQQ